MVGDCQRGPSAERAVLGSQPDKIIFFVLIRHSTDIRCADTMIKKERNDDIRVLWSVLRIAPSHLFSLVDIIFPRRLKKDVQKMFNTNKNVRENKYSLNKGS